MKENGEQSQMQDPTESQACCEGGSCCPSGENGISQKVKVVAFVLIVVAAGAVLANSLVRKSRAGADQPQEAFSVVSTCCDTSETASVPKSEEETAMTVETNTADSDTQKVAPSLWKTELASLASLNQAAADVDAVFVLLGSSSERSSQGISREMEAALVKIKANDTRVSTFWLKDSAPEYANLSQQVKLPCVLAMVKGGGMSVVSDQISQARLVEAFVSASRPSSCGPSGCGPAGCQ